MINSKFLIGSEALPCYSYIKCWAIAVKNQELEIQEQKTLKIK